MQSESKSPGCDSQLSLLNCVTLEINLTSLGLSYLLRNIKVVLSPAKFTESLDEPNEIRMTMSCSQQTTCHFCHNRSSCKFTNHMFTCVRFLGPGKP